MKEETQKTIDNVLCTVAVTSLIWVILCVSFLFPLCKSKCVKMGYLESNNKYYKVTYYGEKINQPPVNGK